MMISIYRRYSLGLWKGILKYQAQAHTKMNRLYERVLPDRRSKKKGKKAVDRDLVEACDDALRPPGAAALRPKDAG